MCSVTSLPVFNQFPPWWHLASKVDFRWDCPAVGYSNPAADERNATCKKSSYYCFVHGKSQDPPVQPSLNFASHELHLPYGHSLPNLNRPDHKGPRLLLTLLWRRYAAPPVIPAWGPHDLSTCLCLPLRHLGQDEGTPPSAQPCKNRTSHQPSQPISQPQLRFTAGLNSSNTS